MGGSSGIPVDLAVQIPTNPGVPSRPSLGTVKKNTLNEIVDYYRKPGTPLSGETKHLKTLHLNETLRTKCSMLENEVSRKTHEIEALRALLLQEKEKNELYEQLKIKFQQKDHEINQLLIIINQQGTHKCNPEQISFIRQQVLGEFEDKYR